LPVILAEGQNPRRCLLLFVIPAGNLLLSLPVFNLQLPTYNFPVKGVEPPSKSHLQQSKQLPDQY